MMDAAQQQEILKSVACFVGLFGVEPRPAGALRLDMTNFAGNRAARMHDGCFALWISATIARKGEQAFDGLF